MVYLHVSILVLLDVFLEDRACEGEKKPPRVSILVLLDVFLEVCFGAGGASWRHGFQSLFSWMFSSKRLGLVHIVRRI